MSTKKKILIISDGNGVDTDFKKWPTLLQILTHDSLLIDNRSVIGASNELIFMQLAEALCKSSYDHVIIQWTGANRVDVVADDFWKEQAQTDFYKFNLVTSNNREWWVTSASDNEHIRLYHDRYIKYWQAHQRTQSYMLAAAQLLDATPYTFTLAYEFEFIEPMAKSLSELNWIWHEDNTGLSEFRHVSKYKSLDKGLAQPHNAIQLEWLHNIIKPGCDVIDYPDERYTQIEKSLINEN